MLGLLTVTTFPKLRQLRDPGGRGAEEGGATSRSELPPLRPSPARAETPGVDCPH